MQEDRNELHRRSPANTDADLLEQIRALDRRLDDETDKKVLDQVNELSLGLYLYSGVPGSPSPSDTDLWSLLETYVDRELNTLRG